MSGVNEREAAMLLLGGQQAAAAQAGMRVAIAAGVLGGLMGGRLFDQCGKLVRAGEFLDAKVELSIAAADKLLEALRRTPKTPPAF